ncbi:MAG: porin [Kiritimatiellia bacterium]
MKRIIVTAMAGILAAVGAQAGPKWELEGESWMKVSFLGQVHCSYAENADPEADVYLRRGRLIISGGVTDGVRFFVETDNDNAGKAGSGSSSTDIQDAFVDLRLGPADHWTGDHWLEAGLILLPFSFENRSSAASLLGIDYNASTIKFVNHFVWRDYGIELHGNFGPRVSYCGGVFDGYDDADGIKSPNAEPRCTGHLAVNLVGEAETGWFYSQSRLSDDSYLSVGVGGDIQDSATLTETAEGATEEKNSKAWVVDVQSGFNLGGSFLTLNGAYSDWENALFAGNTGFVESGLSAGPAMATLKYSTQSPDESDRTTDYTAGLHYHIRGHNARAGVEYRWGDNDDTALLGIQFLL